METVYVFIDESGNFDFSPKGTRHFVLSAVISSDPVHSSHVLQRLKYKLLAEHTGGKIFQHFHATEDQQCIRDRVFDTIRNLGKNLQIFSLFVEKRLLLPQYHTPAELYALIGGTLISGIFEVLKKTPKKIILIFDKALKEKEQAAFFKIVKPKLKHSKIPYAIYFHHTFSDFNGQIADYTAWAKFRSLESEDHRSLQFLKEHVDVFLDIDLRSVHKK